MQHVGSAIRSTREGAGLTLRELAQLSGTSFPYLSNVERGLRTPSARWLRAVEEALAKHLLEGDGDAA